MKMFAVSLPTDRRENLFDILTNEDEKYKFPTLEEDEQTTMVCLTKKLRRELQTNMSKEQYEQTIKLPNDDKALYVSLTENGRDAFTNMTPGDKKEFNFLPEECWRGYIDIRKEMKA